MFPYSPALPLFFFSSDHERRLPHRPRQLEKTDHGVLHIVIAISDR